MHARDAGLASKCKRNLSYHTSILNVAISSIVGLRENCKCAMKTILLRSIYDRLVMPTDATKV